MAPQSSPPVPEGLSRLLSRAAAIGSFFATVIAGRLTPGPWLFAGLLVTGAFWSNCYRLPFSVRVLCVVAELGGVAGALALLVTVPFIAESGRDARLWRAIGLCVCGAIVSLVGSAFVAAARTLRAER